MDVKDFDYLAHFVQSLGDRRFHTLVKEEHRAEVVRFCDEMIMRAAQMSSVIGGRRYELVSFLNPHETVVSGHTMFRRARERGAHLGRSHAEYLLRYQEEIPVEWRGYFIIFTDWLSPDRLYVNCLVWDREQWVHRWSLVNEDGTDADRILRCV